MVVFLKCKMLCFKNIKDSFMEHDDLLPYQERQKRNYSEILGYYKGLS